MNDFKHIAGHEKIIKNLKTAIENKRVSHAYIISGQRGIGKKSIAYAFAKALQCEGYNGDSCGECVSCRSFDSGNHPDIFYVAPTKTKAISVDDIRQQLIKQAEIKQYKYKYKIFIIENADEMTTAAQNALLKTLEEPPDYVVILLLTEDINAFLPTVLSRCAIFKLNPLSSAQVQNYIINNEGISAEKASFYAEYSQGSIGIAKNLLNSENFAQKREGMLKCIKIAEEGDVIAAMTTAKLLEEYKGDGSLLNIAKMHFRDVLVYKQTKEESLVIEQDMLSDIKKEAAKSTLMQIVKRIDAVTEAEKFLQQNVNFMFTMEVMFMKINDKS